MDKQAFKYRSYPDSEARMYDDLTFLLTEWDIPKSMQRNVILAVSEAFTNALIHGNKRDSNKSIELSICVNSEAVMADITDEGTGDLSALRLRKRPRLLDENGRGLDLMESIADALEIKRSDRTGGLQVSMMFRKGNYKDDRK